MSEMESEMNTSVLLAVVYGSRSFHVLYPAGYAQRVLVKLAEALDTAIVVENEEATIVLNHHNVMEAWDVFEQMDRRSADWLELVAGNVILRKMVA